MQRMYPPRHSRAAARLGSWRSCTCLPTRCTPVRRLALSLRVIAGTRGVMCTRVQDLADGRHAACEPHEAHTHAGRRALPRKTSGAVRKGLPPGRWRSQARDQGLRHPIRGTGPMLPAGSVTVPSSFPTNWPQDCVGVAKIQCGAPATRQCGRQDCTLRHELRGHAVLAQRLRAADAWRSVRAQSANACQLSATRGNPTHV